MSAPKRPGPTVGLLLAGRQIARAVEARLVADKLTAAEAVLLAQLAEDGPMTMNTVRLALGVEKSTATSLTDRLQKRGLIERKENPSDKRSLVVHLSRGAGLRVAKKAASAIAAVDADLSLVSENALRGHRQVVQRVHDLAAE